MFISARSARFPAAISAAIDASGHALTGDGLNGVCGSCCDLSAGRIVRHGTRQRMLRSLLERGGQSNQVSFRSYQLHEWQ